MTLYTLTENEVNMLHDIGPGATISWSFVTLFGGAALAYIADTTDLQVHGLDRKRAGSAERAAGWDGELLLDDGAGENAHEGDAGKIVCPPDPPPPPSTSPSVSLPFNAGCDHWDLDCADGHSIQQFTRWASERQ